MDRQAEAALAEVAAKIGSTMDRGMPGIVEQSVDAAKSMLDAALTGAEAGNMDTRVRNRIRESITSVEIAAETIARTR